MMDTKEAEQIVKNLISNDSPENIQYEYKQSFFGSQIHNNIVEFNDETKVKFLRPILSFANSYGGYLIFGIEEVRRTHHIQLKPLTGITNIDTLKKQLNDIIHQNIEPPIPGINIQEVLQDVGNYVIVIQIPNSPLKPHMEKVSKNNPFYIRTSSGNKSMDYRLLENLFIEKKRLHDYLESFKVERLEEIKNDNQFKLAPKLIIFLYSYQSFNVQNNLNIDQYVSKELPVLNKTGNKKDEVGYEISYHKNELNLYGILRKKFFKYPNNNYDLVGYTQMHRNGVFEIVDQSFLWENHNHLFVFHDSFLRGLPPLISDLMSLIKDDSSPPFYLTVTLLNFKGLRFDYLAPDIAPKPFERNLINLPIVTLSSFDLADISKQIEPTIISHVWNAQGLRSPEHYGRSAI